MTSNISVQHRVSFMQKSIRILQDSTTNHKNPLNSQISTRNVSKLHNSSIYISYTNIVHRDYMDLTTLICVKSGMTIFIHLCRIQKRSRVGGRLPASVSRYKAAVSTALAGSPSPTLFVFKEDISIKISQKIIF